MANRLNDVFVLLRRLTRGPARRDESDGSLLERYVLENDEEAFAELVHRHATVVYGMCRRILQDSHDAEDVFQAAILVLARKAGAIRRRESVGSWMCGVAYRLAMKVRSREARRREISEVPDMPAESVPERESAEPILYEEIGSLPEKYRAPLVMCYLEGKTNDEAARELGWPIGSMSRRLTKARDLLKARLERRGVAIAGAGLTALLADCNVRAAVPPTILSDSIRHGLEFASGNLAGGVSSEVVRLADAMVRSLTAARWRNIAALTLLVLFSACGAGILAHALQTKRPEAAAEPPGVRDHFEFKTPGFASSIYFGLDGKNVAVHGAGKVVVGDLVTGTVQSFDCGSVLPIIPSNVLSVTSERLIVAVGNQVETYDLSTGAKSITATLEEGEKPVAYGPAGELWTISAAKKFGLERDLTARDRHGKPIDLRGAKTSHQPRVSASPGGKWLATYDGSAIDVWNLVEHKKHDRIGIPRGVLFPMDVAFAFSNDDRYLAIAQRGLMGSEGGVQVRDLSSMKEIANLPVVEGKLECPIMGEGLLLQLERRVGKPASLRAWDVKRGNELRVEDAVATSVFSAAISPDGRLIAYGADQGRVLVRPLSEVIFLGQ